MDAFTTEHVDGTKSATSAAAAGSIWNGIRKRKMVKLTPQMRPRVPTIASRMLAFLSLAIGSRDATEPLSSRSNDS